MNPATARGNRLILKGPATMRTIEAIHARLSRLIEEKPAVEIDCSAATEVDLSLIQLLLAARKGANASGKTLILSRPASGALRDALMRSGLLTAAGGSERDEHNFWLTGATDQ